MFLKIQYQEKTKKYATVKDTVFRKNIFPPQCNCNISVYRRDEIEKIMADPDINKNGVCRHLMKLNEEWENMIIEGRTYMTQTDVKATMLSAGIEDEFGERSSFGNAEKEEAECITMSSVLFCKHGGLIMPVTSGQILYGETFKYIDKDGNEIEVVWTIGQLVGRTLIHGKVKIPNMFNIWKLVRILNV